MEIEGRQVQSQPMTSQRASQVNAGAAITRHSRASRVDKSWMGSVSLGTEVDLITGIDAADAGLDTDVATQIVKCTTRFATLMCVAIAVVKVSIYFATKQDVVRTSALDSLGDLLANCITLYTGVRMRQIDKKRYPAGQGKFQSIGCLVFSTLMFSLMFGNALGNVESLVESEDDVGFKAVSRFFYMSKYGDESIYTGEFKKWADEVEYDKEEDKYKWNSVDNTIDNFVKAYYMQAGDDDEKELAKHEDENPSLVNRTWLVNEVAMYESDAKKREDLRTQNVFLGCCATYKLCLWQYCVWYAIPKSASSVLVALANDKRNDCVGTYSVIVATTVAFIFRKSLPISEEKVDPLVSLILSVFIMYSWSTLMVEHMTILSMEAGSDDFCNGVREIIETAIHSSPCEIKNYEDIKVYHSSERHTIEVHLTISDPNTAFGEVAKFCKSLRAKLEPLPDVENVVLHTKTISM